jgi:hypothetical protein
MEIASYHHSTALNLEVAPKFFENLWNPVNCFFLHENRISGNLRKLPHMTRRTKLSSQSGTDELMNNFTQTCIFHSKQEVCTIYFQQLRSEML